MRTRRVVFVTLTVIGLMAGSFTFGYVARRNEWISISTRHQVRTLGGKLATASEGAVIHDSTGIPEGEFNTGDGNWSRVDPTQISPPIIDGEVVETLNALGYLDGYEAPASSESGVVLADRSRCFGGYRLYVSGHKPEARLIATDGTLVHEWTAPYARAFPDIPPHETYAGRFRKAYVYPGGAGALCC